MQPSLSFSFLFTALLFALTQVGASPAKRQPGTVALPLKRLPQRPDVHPSVLLKRYIDRKRSRHARMNGHGDPYTAELAKRAAANSLGLATTADESGYVTIVQAGTPPRDFSVRVDSGSADFWVGGEGCVTESGGSCGNHVLLGPGSSSSFQKLGKAWETTYDSSRVTGDIVTDNVKIAGLALDKHTFGVALVESSSFTEDSTTDGFLGLAMSSLSSQGVQTPVEALAQRGLISKAITSYKIPRSPDDLSGGITFGGLDESKFNPNTLVTFQNVNQGGLWGGSFTASVNDGSLKLSGNAILDTGTTLIIAPPADAETYHAGVPGSKSEGQGVYTVPCVTTTAVSFTFGGRAFAVNPNDLKSGQTSAGSDDCYSSVLGGGAGGSGEWVLGAAFLKNVYFSHDLGANAISLAELV